MSMCLYSISPYDNERCVIVAVAAKLQSATLRVANHRPSISPAESRNPANLLHLVTLDSSCLFQSAGTGGSGKDRERLGAEKTESG